MGRSKIDARRIKRMRHPPRVVSIAGDVGESTPLEVQSDLTPPLVEVKIEPIRPQVVSSVTMRPEFSTSNTMRTTVDNYPGEESLRRVSPPIVNGDQFWNGSKLIRPRSESKSESTSVPTIDRDPVYVRDPAELRVMTEDLQSENGLHCKPGQNILVELLGRRNRSNPMNYVIEGDQAVRVAVLDGSGGLLNDIEYAPHSLPTELCELPQKAAYLALTGLGDHVDFESIQPGSGAVTLTCSTDDTAAIGFHPPNRLVRLHSGRYLCRGGAIITDGTIDDVRPWTTAEKCLTGATMVNLQMSSSVETVVVITEQNAQPSINSIGIDVTGNSHTVQGNQVTATLWSVSKTDGGEDTCSITIQTSERSKIHSVIAMRGGIEHWIGTMETNDWSTIVEEGAISNRGTASIRFVGAENEETVPTKEQAYSSKRQEKNEQGEVD